jgi:hypothetical protein
MTIESATFINQLVPANPGASDLKSEGDDHLRLTKQVLQNTFPAIVGAVSATDTELSFVHNVTSAIQTQLNTKAVAGSVGTTVSVSKPATTTRTSTTVKAVDPDLAITLSTLGTYAILLWAPVWTTTTNVGGLSWNISFSGTSPTSFIGADAFVNNTTMVAFGSNDNFSAATIQVNGNDWIRCIGTLTISTGGSVALNWAQNSSSASSANVGLGAWLSVTRVA